MLSQAEGLADDAGGVAFISRGDIALHAMKFSKNQLRIRNSLIRRTPLPLIEAAP